MDSYNTLIRITYNSESVTTYETFDVKDLRKTISKLFTNFKDTKLIDIIKTEPEIYDLYYPINNQDKKGFPIIYISPGYTKEYEVRYSLETLINYPKLKTKLETEITNIQITMLEKWNQGLHAIGFL